MGSQLGLNQPEGAPRYWYRDHFLLTTDKSLLDASVVNAIFDSDLMWWNEPMQLDMMQKMLDGCLTIAIYAVPETADQMKKNGPPRRPNGPELKLIGLARVVTDYVTIAYLTDVFVLPEYQRRGLAAWMMRGVREMVSEWPHLRGMLVMTENTDKAKLYEKELGAVPLDKGPSAGFFMYEMPGNGSKLPLDSHV
ncbi:hypothetical protein S40285_06352 [Stachybotrys chlorohalonatus IBT 40285]|uniref:N-acetyltransferase domain-containing protein n=1 Tax=Stachybotrys chlorohalonatus (strain IBT 40285) TaxID=1283841 RepID=A0A084QAT6_STAC4|nr:hypothetical protein S40285_06352 [Stachybotrys chlorohalonata IBT 40285]